MNIREIYRKVVPSEIRRFLTVMYTAHTIIHYYSKPNRAFSAQKKYVDFLKKNKFTLTTKQMIFLSSFVDKYDRIDVNVLKCEKTGLYYVIHKNKKLFWKRNVDIQKIEEEYKLLLAEQDENSPHLYWKNKNDYLGKILFDVGAAEGLITLNLIEDIKFACLFECESDWVEALRVTFEPYKDKIKIIEKYISDTLNEEKNMMTIDDFVEKNGINPDVIKMDIEGHEERALIGTKRTIIDAKYLLLIICAYHKANAEKNITSYLDSYNYVCETSKGYMFYDLNPPYFRRGIVRANRG